MISPLVIRRFSVVSLLLTLLASVAVAEEQGSPLMHGPSGVSLSRDNDRIYAISDPYIFYHDIGLLEMLITNIGIFGNPSFTDGPSAGWRNGEYLYAACLWIGRSPQTITSRTFPRDAMKPN